MHHPSENAHDIQRETRRTLNINSYVIQTEQHMFGSYNLSVFKKESYNSEERPELIYFTGGFINRDDAIMFAKGYIHCHRQMLLNVGGE